MTPRPAARPDRRGGTRRPGRVMSRLVGRLVVLALLAALLLPVAVAARVVQVAGRDERVPADAVVVLGASQLDGTPGAVLRARLEQARDLYADGLAPLVVTTGGSAEGDRFTEADSARSWLVEAGVPEDDVVAVPVGSDTYESLVPVARLASERGWQQGVLVVSDPWHVYRVRTMADDLGLPVAGSSPTRSGPGAGDPARVASYVARETAGTLFHHLVR